MKVGMQIQVRDSDRTLKISKEKEKTEKMLCVIQQTQLNVL